MKMLCNKLTYISPHIDNSLPPNILLVDLHVAANQAHCLTDSFTYFTLAGKFGTKPNLLISSRLKVNNMVVGLPLNTGPLTAWHTFMAEQKMKIKTG